MTTNPEQVVRFQYTQSLSWDKGTGSHWSEVVQASVTITDFAISSGWLRENFTNRRGGANDFVVLFTIVMHARPLVGADLDYLTRLGMAAPQDEGRLYARVTDMGLSEELGIDRKTIATIAQRLAEMKFITIAEIPEDLAFFRDSHGRYEGSKVYLLAGDLNARLMAKNLEARQPGANPVHRGVLHPTVESGPETAGDHRGALHPTVKTGPESADGHRGVLHPTVEPDSPATVGHPAPPPGESHPINLRGEEGEVFFSPAGGGGKRDFSPVFARFAELRGAAYTPTQRDFEAVAELTRQGYTPDEILAGVERVAANAGGSLQEVRQFTYCRAEILSRPPQARSGLHAPAALPAGPSAAPPAEPTAVPTVSSPEPISPADPNAVAAPPANGVDAVPPAAPAPSGAPAAGIVPEDVLLTFVQAFGRAPSPAEHNRLVWLHDRCAGAVQAAGGEAWEWIVAALQDSNPEAEAPVAYIRKLIDRRLERAASARPAAGRAAKPSAAGPETQPPAADVPSRALSVPAGGGEYDPIIVNGLPITKLKPRKTGYITPGEESMGYLHDFARRILNPETNDDNP